MAYGTQERVLFYLGINAVDSTYFTAANIAIAIADADVWVDSIDSSADSSNKTAASSAYAAYLMRRNRAEKIASGGKKGPSNAQPSFETSDINDLKQIALGFLQNISISFTKDYQIV